MYVNSTFHYRVDFQSKMVLAHIRKANLSLSGRSCVFAHNGKLPGLHNNPASAVHRYHPLGETDSEFAFCLLLDALAQSTGNGDDCFSPDHIVLTIRPLVGKLAAMGEINFILGNGRHMIVHAHTHLHTLQRVCNREGCAQQVILIATSPLTGEPRVQLANGYSTFIRTDEILPRAQSARAGGEVSFMM